MPELSFRLIIDSAGAEAKLEQTGEQVAYLIRSKIKREGISERYVETEVIEKH